MYEKNQVIGEGGFGKVYKGKNKETGELVAIKTIDLTEFCTFNYLISFSEECQCDRRPIQGIKDPLDVEPQEHNKALLRICLEERTSVNNGICRWW